MSAIGYFLWLVEDAAYWLGVSIPVSIALIVGAIAAVFHESLRPAMSWWRLAVVAIIPAVVPFVQLLVGVLFFTPEHTAWHSGPPRVYFPDADHEWVVVGLFFLHIPLAIALWAWLRPRWWTSLVVTLAWMWITCGSTLVACESVTGRWL